MNKFTFDKAVHLDCDGFLSSEEQNNYGFRLFYKIPASEMKKVPIENPMLARYRNNAGMMEFTVNENGDQVGEVLLWFTDKGVYTDYVEYDEDISNMVSDANARIKELLDL